MNFVIDLQSIINSDGIQNLFYNHLSILIEFVIDLRSIINNNWFETNYKLQVCLIFISDKL